MIIIEKDFKPDFEWDSRLLKSKNGIIFQTKEYGSYVESRLKAKPMYLKFTKNGIIEAQLLAFQSFKGRKKLANLIGRGNLYSFLSKIPILPKFTFWDFGPIIFNPSYKDDVLETLGNFLLDETYHFKGSIHPLNSDYAFPKKFNFKKKEMGTFVIDLKQDIKQIFKNTNKKSVQKNIKRSMERGVTVTQISTKDDLVTYYNILNQFRKANNLTSYSYEDVVEGYEYVKPVGQTGFLAWRNQKPVGGIFISSFNGYINEAGIARTSVDHEERLYSLDLLRWKVIEWGIENNCNYYDLSGVEIKNRTKKEDSIYQNKKKWGGELMKYNIYSN